MIELVIWPQEVTLARWTQPSGPLCLWQCFLTFRRSEAPLAPIVRVPPYENEAFLTNFVIPRPNGKFFDHKKWFLTCTWESLISSLWPLKRIERQLVCCLTSSGLIIDFKTWEIRSAFLLPTNWCRMLKRWWLSKGRKRRQYKNRMEANFKNTVRTARSNKKSELYR